MGLFITERLKEQFGQEKEAVDLYEKETGKNVKQLYRETFFGDDVQKGTLFEFYVFKKLYKIKGYHRFLFNVILPTEKGTTEIDVLFLHETGIFVYECKSYSGKIYGNEKYKMWNQYLDGKKNQFYSPILQNQGHINALKKYLNEKESEWIFSFIAFSNRAELKVEYEPYRVLVGDTEACISENKILIKKLQSEFGKDEIDALYDRLYIYAKNSEKRRKEHVDYVRKVKNIDYNI